MIWTKVDGKFCLGLLYDTCCWKFDDPPKQNRSYKLETHQYKDIGIKKWRWTRTKRASIPKEVIQIPLETQLSLNHLLRLRIIWKQFETKNGNRWIVSFTTTTVIMIKKKGYSFINTTNNDTSTNAISNKMCILSTKKSDFFVDYSNGNEVL